jgi:hypothetical protein
MVLGEEELVLVLYMGVGGGEVLLLRGHLLQVEEEHVGQLSELRLLVQQLELGKGHIASSCA